jgi:uncharacterized membrane protein
VNSESLATRHRSHLLILALIVCFAGALRFYSLSTLGFWTDEFCSVSAADGWGLQLDQVPVNQIVTQLPICTRLRDARSFFQIPAGMARDDTHPPLYFLLLRGWDQIFGDSESAVRSLNVVFSLLAIILLYFVARNSVGSTTALVACLLMAVATPQIQFSQEARNYMPVLVFLLLVAMAIAKLKRSPSPYWAGILSVFLLAMMLTHYFAAGAAVGLMGYAFIVLRKRPRRFALIASAVAAMIFALLWGKSMLKQRSSFLNGLSWLFDREPGHVHRRIFDLCRLPVRFFTEITGSGFQPFIAIIGVLLLLALPVLFLYRRELRIWIAWLIAAIALVAIADFTRSTTQLNWVRYTIFATPPAYVLLSAGIPRGRLKFVLPSIAIAAAILTLPNAYVPAWKPDFRTPIQIVGRTLTAEDGLVISGKDPIAAGIMVAAFQHYLPNQPAVYVVLTESPDAATLSRLQQCPHICFVRQWPYPSTGLPGFVVNAKDEESIPFFADFAVGRLKAHSR